MEHGTHTNDNHAALWSGRFAEGPDAAAVEFETSIYVDERMALDDIHGSVAHATMLGEQNIIPVEDARKIVEGLKSIERDLESGVLKIDYSAEDIHSFVEATLTDRIGETGKKLHTGRSRNDQIALDERLYLRRVIPLLQNEIVTLIETLSGIAAAHTTTLLTGYTHMQHAQPGTLAQHLCAWSFMLVRDWERIEDALSRISKSPLGSGALQGSTLPLNRERVASLLSFDGVTDNSLDTVSDRDYCIEFTSAFAVLQSHLSRMCEEIINLQNVLPNMRAFVGYDESLSHLIEAGSDFFLMPSRYEPCGLNQMYSILYGTLPIVRRTGGLADTVEQYNENTGDGTGFLFDSLTPEAVYNTVGWATYAYYNKKDHILKM